MIEYENNCEIKPEIDEIERILSLQDTINKLKEVIRLKNDEITTLKKA